MKKKYIFIIPVLLFTAACFIPVPQQKSILIKSPFLNVFIQLQNPENWKKWRPDLRKVVLKDSDKIITKNFPGSFIINCPALILDVKLIEGSFKISEQNSNESFDYDLTVLPGKTPVNSLVIIKDTLPLIKYVANIFNNGLPERTHIADLKSFMEIDSLFYGCNIFKIRVPSENLIVMRKEVLKADKFTEASKMLAALQRYIKLNNITQIQPLIAQFIPKGKDSAQVNVGLFINKEVQSENGISFNRMPKGGPLYCTQFNGPFNKRQKVYTALKQYFFDKRYQQAIRPFETYLDNKLPLSDTDKIKIRVNFSAYF